MLEWPAAIRESDHRVRRRDQGDRRRRGRDMCVRNHDGVASSMPGQRGWRRARAQRAVTSGERREGEREREKKEATGTPVVAVEWEAASQSWGEFEYAE